MKGKFKKIICFIVSICFIVTILPVMTFAGEYDGPSDESSQYMQYWTNLDYGAYDIEGKVEGHDGWLKTTYASRYFSKIIIGELSGIQDLYNAGYWLEEMQNGVEKLYPGDNNSSAAYSMLNEEQAILGVTQTLSLVYNNRYVKIQYKVRNITDTPQTFSLGSNADVQIGDDDYANIYKLSNGSGFHMEGAYPVVAQFNFIGRNAYGVTNVDSFWFGHYSSRNENMFNHIEMESLTGVDSGMAFSWKDRIIQPGETQTLSVLIGVGEVSSAPDLLVTIPAETFGDVVKGGTYGFTANVSDSDNTFGTEVYYVIDNGSPVKTYTFEGAPGDFNSSITLPVDISLGSHTISFYAQDTDGAVSPVVTRTLNVVNMYTATFNVNGGSTVNPITGILQDALIIAPSPPTKTGFTFDGWYKDADLTVKWNFETDKVTDNLTLYAKWIENKVAVVNVPKTGDNAPIGIMSILIVFSIYTGVVLLKNRKIKIN